MTGNGGGGGADSVDGGDWSSEVDCCGGGGGGGGGDVDKFVTCVTAFVAAAAEMVMLGQLVVIGGG